MTIPELIKQLDDALTQINDRYVKLHDQFRTYRGRQLNETEYQEVADLFNQIQDTFKEMYPIFYYLLQRHQVAVNYTNNYEEFLAELKKAGFLVDRQA